MQKTTLRFVRERLFFLSSILLAACGVSAPTASATHVVLAAEIPSVADPAIEIAKVPTRVRVVIGGDLLPHRPQLVLATSMATALAPISPLLKQADVSIANYETATGDPSRLTLGNTMSLAASPDWIRAVHSAGFEAVTVANNHACDLGKKGLDQTILSAREASLIPLGGGKNPWGARLIAEKDHKRICVVAWTTISNAEGGCAHSTELAVADYTKAGLRLVSSALEKAKATCDATIAIFHGGEEYVEQTPEALAMAHVAAEAGASVVAIHHPHVVSPLIVATTRDGRRVPIFSSLGNLVSNQGETWDPTFPARQKDRHTVYLNGWTRLGMLADIEFEFDASSAANISWGYHLVWTDNDHAKNKADPHPRIETRLLDDEVDRAVIAKLSRDTTGPTSTFENICRIHKTNEGPSCR